MSNDTKVVGLGEARKQRERDPHRVPCANCGKPIALASTKCVHCGITFQGTAVEFAPGGAPATPLEHRRRRLVKALVGALVVAFASAMLVTR